MSRTYDIAVDFMDLDAAGRLWALPADVKAEAALTIGRHVTVGDDGAVTRVAQIVGLGADGSIELQVLPGGVGSNARPVARG